MKTRRSIAILLFLAVVACALVLTMRSFAQSGPYDITLNDQKLKAPYDNDADLWEKNILKKHSKKYCITHKKNDGSSSKHCPKSEAATSQSLIVPVASSSAPAPMGDKPAGINVTQQISCATAADKQAIEATFDTTGL
jgi:hypothetical protein